MPREPKVRKVPLRMCVGCGEMKPKQALVRVVKSQSGLVCVDRGGRLPGRGAYVCDHIECLKKARKARRLERAFAMKIPDEIYTELERELSNE